VSSSSAERPLRVGVIGVGWAGQQHLAAYHDLPDSEIAAIAGMEADVLEETGARYGVDRLLPRWEDLVELEELDAVSVCVPTFLHAPITLAALERGLHVLTEKPMARNAAEADAMVAAARKAGRVLSVSFQRRGRGDVRKLKAILDAGRLGKPYYAKGYWMRRTGIPTMGSWFTRAELAGGGPLVDIGVHVLDYALFLLGGPKVTAVSAATYNLLGSAGFGSDPGSGKSGAVDPSTFEVEDLATVFVRLEGGATLLLEVSWAAHRDATDEYGITLFGTQGGAELRVINHAPSGSLRLFTDDDGVPAETRLVSPPGSGHHFVVEGFLEAIRSGDAAAHDGADAAEVTRVIDACYRSASERREIRL
jgi:predicted dehydrogenase